MDIADYWLMAREYLIWNTTVASLQFWTADLNTITLSTTIEEVYLAFFYTTSTYTLHQQSDEIFSCFVTTLNAAFEWKLSLEDGGYESNLENSNMPTPLRKMPKIHHISSIKNTSFDPNPVTPWSMVHLTLGWYNRWLTYSSSNDSDTSEETLTARRATSDAQVYLEEDDKEDFQMVPLDDKYWTTEEVPDRNIMHT